MVSLGTAVFRRVIEEAREKGFILAREVGVNALTETMQKETVRFGTFDSQYVRKCAEDRWRHYSNSANPSCANQVAQAS